MSNHRAVAPRRAADVRGRGTVTAPKRMIEVGKITEAGLKSDRADHVTRKTRIDQTAMRASEPLIQHEVGERGLIALEQCPDVARRNAVPARHGFDRQLSPGKVGENMRLDRA